MSQSEQQGEARKENDQTVQYKQDRTDGGQAEQGNRARKERDVREQERRFEKNGTWKELVTNESGNIALRKVINKGLELTTRKCRSTLDEQRLGLNNVKKMSKLEIMAPPKLDRKKQKKGIAE